MEPEPPAVITADAKPPPSVDELAARYKVEDPGSYPCYERPFEVCNGPFDRDLIVPCAELRIIRQTLHYIEVLCPEGVDPCAIAVKPVGKVRMYDLIYVGQKKNTNGKLTYVGPVRFHILQRYYKQFTMTWEQTVTPITSGLHPNNSAPQHTVAIDVGVPPGSELYQNEPEQSSSWCQII